MINLLMLSEDKVEEYVANQIYGSESAFDEGHIGKRLWTRIITSSLLVGRWRALMNELDRVNKLDSSFVKEETTEVKFSEEDMKTLTDALGIVEYAKGMPERLANHSIRAMEILKKIDKKIYAAKDVHEAVRSKMPSNAFTIANITKILFIGWRAPQPFIDAFLKESKQAGFDELVHFPFIFRPPIKLSAGFLKVFTKINQFLYLWVIVNLAIGVLTSLIAVIQTARVDKFIEDSDVKYIKDYYNLIYKDLSKIYKVSAKDGKSMVERLDAIISNKTKTAWEYQKKVDFVNLLKKSAPAQVDALKAGVKIMTSKEYASIVRTTKAIITASYKINSSFEDGARYEEMVSLLETNQLVMSKVVEAYVKIIKEMRKF